MRTWVQKFGGSSLSTPEARSHAVRQIKCALNEGVKLVIVVSAMGRKGDPYATDTLLAMIEETGHRPPEREMDMLLSCGETISAVMLCSLLMAENIASQVLNGAQAGIITDDQHGRARITRMQPQRILEMLKDNQVVIVTGFQGVTQRGDITTLGRGGSDTSAAALGVALNAEYIDIFTDVEGILTADPRIVKNALQISTVSYGEICNMAYNGAKVIHPRAVEIAMQGNVPIRVRSTFSADKGTLVTHQHVETSKDPFSDRYVTGIANVSGISQIRVIAQQDDYDLQLKVFKAMAESHISVDFINVNPSEVIYTVPADQLDRAKQRIAELGYKALYKPECAKVSVVGGGINGVPGIMAQIVEALTSNNIPILQTADSNTTIWVLVENQDMEQTVIALHQQFLC